MNDLLREAVQKGREGGISWAEIGDLVGTTKQAAHHRFSAPQMPENVLLDLEADADLARHRVLIIEDSKPGGAEPGSVRKIVRKVQRID
jgi:hypothetical protein